MAVTPQATSGMFRTGILLMIGGIAALAAPMFAGSAAMSILGWIMLVSGIVEFVQFLTSGDEEERSGSLVGGVMTGFVGFVIIRNPAITGDGMLVLVGWFLMGGGLIRLASAIKSRPPHWEWRAASGIVDVGLGVLLWNAVVQQSVGTIGILLGIALIFRGVPKIMAGLAVKKLQAA